MLEDELAMANKKLKKSEDDEVVVDTASLVKEAPEPLRKMLEDLEKSAQDATARANAAEEILKAEPYPVGVEFATTSVPALQVSVSPAWKVVICEFAFETFL